MEPLKPQDIKAGQFVTILKGAMYGHTEDQSWKGNVIQVVHVEYPFMVAINHEHSCSFRSNKHTFDLTCYTFGAISDEYVKAAGCEHLLPKA